MRSNEQEILAQPARSTARPRTGAATRSFDTVELFDGRTEIEIVHEHVIYRLKITRQGKLILNK
jgi:hemin uptake protein HemP